MQQWIWDILGVIGIMIVDAILMLFAIKAFINRALRKAGIEPLIFWSMCKATLGRGKGEAARKLTGERKSDGTD